MLHQLHLLRRIGPTNGSIRVEKLQDWVQHWGTRSAYLVIRASLPHNLVRFRSRMDLGEQSPLSGIIRSSSWDLGPLVPLFQVVRHRYARQCRYPRTPNTTSGNCSRESKIIIQRGYCLYIKLRSVLQKAMQASSSTNPDIKNRKYAGY